MKNPKQLLISLSPVIPHDLLISCEPSALVLATNGGYQVLIESCAETEAR